MQISLKFRLNDACYGVCVCVCAHQRVCELGASSHLLDRWDSASSSFSGSLLWLRALFWFVFVSGVSTLAFYSAPYPSFLFPSFAHTLALDYEHAVWPNLSDSSCKTQSIPAWFKAAEVSTECLFSLLTLAPRCFCLHSSPWAYGL